MVDEFSSGKMTDFMAWPPPKLIKSTKMPMPPKDSPQRTASYVSLQVISLCQ
ncbi:hypothetical protein HanLR1_Chr01g0021041 [Helianthus annuus]|nr:hypothetical protein HanLR1_Chr01g0021041 [Helianthus annuus]